MSSPQSFRSTYQNPNKPELMMQGLQLQHNIFNHQQQRAEKDDLEEDWSG